jgi:hypothetical protein
MTPPERDGGDVACEAAAAADDDIDRGVAADVCWVAGEGWVVCLFGCWVEALAFEREGDWRKAAKKVERKKGRWEDMLPAMDRSRGGDLKSRGVRDGFPRLQSGDGTNGSDAACGLGAIFSVLAQRSLVEINPWLVEVRLCLVGEKQWLLVCLGRGSLSQYM